MGAGAGRAARLRGAGRFLERHPIAVSLHGDPGHDRVVERRPFAIYWYVRSDSHVFGPAWGNITEPHAFGEEEAERWRSERLELTSPREVSEAKRMMRERGYVSGRVRAIRVTVYRRRRHAGGGG